MNYTMSKDHIKAMIVFLKEKQNECIVTPYADLFLLYSYSHIKGTRQSMICHVSLKPNIAARFFSYRKWK